MIVCLLFIDPTSLYPYRAYKKGISNAQLLMVASSGLIARECNDSDAKHLSDRLILVWCSCEIPGDINMPAACYRYSSDDRVHDSTYLYLKIASRCLLVCEPSLSPLVWERYYIHSGRWMKRAAPFRKDQKENLFFRESYPREKNSSFQLASLELQASLQNTGSTSIEYRNKRQQQTTATPVATADEEADLFVGNESRVFPESFPSFVPGTSTKVESTYVLSNNRIDPCRVSARELLKLLALFRPSRVIIQPQADRTAKSHESWRNTTVKLKRSKTPWLSWWHCNKIATCSLHLGGIKVLTLNEQRDEM